LQEIFDNTALTQICEKLANPVTINEVEDIEAHTKAIWKTPVENGLNPTEQQRFVEYFSRVGFVAKYKSYGTKYATPFGYSLFDLKNNAGFSIQLHEEEKIEAFHILSTQLQSFLLLGSIDDWDENKEEFLALWEEGTPERSSLVYRPEPGDIALVENLNTVHTVIGCILEEYATSSYDVVTRLHDQNKGDNVFLPEKHIPIADVLSRVQSFEPKRLIRKSLNGWDEQNISADEVLVDLPDGGLLGMHKTIGNHPINLEVPEDSITTIVALHGETLVEIDGFQQLIVVGGTTAIPPGAKYKLKNASIYDQSRVSICQVRAQTAFADLRTVAV